MLSIVGLISISTFANNTDVKSKKIKIVEKKEIKKQKTTLQEVVITVNCPDGSSWRYYCDGCTTAQLIAKAMQLCC